MRTFAIGDIHGNYRGLLQVLERSGFDKESDRLYVLGDVCDGWSQVPECVEELLTIKNLIILLGNHDKWAMDWLQFGIDKPQWLMQGGMATYDAYNINVHLKDKHMNEYFNKAHDYYIDENNYAYVHGGWCENRRGLGFNNRIDYLWDRSMWYALGTYHHMGLQSPITKMYDKVFIGHTCTGIKKPEKRCNCWNLDSGAGWDGKLTIMDVNTEEYWQSDDTDILYPDEKGRRG